MSLHLSLELLVEGLELVHVCGLGGPAYTKTLCLVGFRDLFRWLIGYVAQEWTVFGVKVS